MKEYGEDTKLVEACNRLSAAKGAQCALELPSPHKVELYPIQVAFQYITSRDERKWFQNLPTSFKLPPATVDRLRAIGRRLLDEDPQFKSLMRALHGCLAPAGGTC